MAKLVEEFERSQGENCFFLKRRGTWKCKLFLLGVKRMIDMFF